VPGGAWSIEQEGAMFTESAELYDIIYSGFKDYRAESSPQRDASSTSRAAPASTLGC
jgi:hypothetical protein